jgi:hypothetical protein
LFAAINGWTPTNLLWRRRTSFFICQEHSIFTLIVQRCSLFLELRLAFFFALIFVQILFYLCIMVYLDHWSMLVYIKSVVSKRFEWCWKRGKKFHAKSGTKRSLFGLRLRILHAMLDVILIEFLVVFAIA